MLISHWILLVWWVVVSFFLSIWQNMRKIYVYGANSNGNLYTGSYSQRMNDWKDVSIRPNKTNFSTLMLRWTRLKAVVIIESRFHPAVAFMPIAWELFALWLSQSSNKAFYEHRTHSSVISTDRKRYWNKAKKRRAILCVALCCKGNSQNINNNISFVENHDNTKYAQCLCPNTSSEDTVKVTFMKIVKNTQKLIDQKVFGQH